MGVIKNVRSLIRHPSLIPILIGYVIAYTRDDAEREIVWRTKALGLAERMGRGERLAERWRARDAQLLIKTGKFEEAREELLELLKLRKGSDDSKSRHEVLFARYYIAMLDGKPEQADYWARLAHEEGLSSIGLTEIPPPLSNRLAQEWDEEIEALSRREKQGKL